MRIIPFILAVLLLGSPSIVVASVKSNELDQDKPKKSGWSFGFGFSDITADAAYKAGVGFATKLLNKWSVAMGSKETMEVAVASAEALGKEAGKEMGKELVSYLRSLDSTETGGDNGAVLKLGSMIDWASKAIKPFTPTAVQGFLYSVNVFLILAIIALVYHLSEKLYDVYEALTSALSQLTNKTRRLFRRSSPSRRPSVRKNKNKKSLNE